ncbi:LppX_LprAFG lipoprotein [Streptomyces stramineus]
MAAGLVLGLTACGGGGNGKADPVADLKAAAGKAAEQNSYKAKGTSKDHEGETSLEMLYSEKPWASDLKGTGPKSADNPTGEIRMMNTGGNLYIKSGEPVGGKAWMKVEVGEARQAPKSDSMRSAGLQAAVLATSKDVKKVGEEKVGGRKTTHYKGTVTLSELAAYKGDLLTEKQRDSYAQPAMYGGAKTLDLDVWVDANDLPAKTRESSKGSKGESTTTLEFLEYGLKVNVQPPPCEVASMKDMMKG